MCFQTRSYRGLPDICNECERDGGHEPRNVGYARYAQQRSQRWDARAREQAAHQGLARMFITGFRKLAFTKGMVDEGRWIVKEIAAFVGRF